MIRIVLILLGLALASCGDEGDAETRFRVPRPDLAGVDAAVRTQLDRQAGELESTLARGEASASQLSQAIGELGRTYHAYDLTTDAEACYREARRLGSNAEWSYYLGFLEQVRGDLEGAAESFRGVLEAVPDDTAASQRLADVLAQLGRDDEAAEVYSGILEIDPGAAAAHRGLGTLDAAAGRLRPAISHFERALELQPGATSLHYRLAQAYRALGLEADAERHAGLAGTVGVSFADPRVEALDELAVGAGVRLARGGVALAQGRPELAIEEYRQAVAADPDNVAARTNLALLLGRAGDVAEAREHLEEALRVEPANPTALLAIGALSLSEGEPEPARRAFERVLEHQPEHAGALRGRADAALAMDDRALALEASTRLVELAPEDGSAHLLLGTVLQQAGDLDGAGRELEAALRRELEPADVGAAHLGLANVRAASGAFERALEHYEAALDADPRLAPAAYNRAGVLARLGRYDEAAEGYRLVLELEPERAEAHFYLAEALLRAGRPVPARGAFEVAVVETPEDERAHLGLAVSLAHLGRHAAALASLEASARRLPRSGLLAHELALSLASSPDRSLRDGARATEIASRLLAAQPSAANAEVLAMALAEAGRFDEAVEIQKRLIDEVGAAADSEGFTTNPAVVVRLRRVLELYEGGESCCPPPS